ncbi:DUF3466 family protein [Undibacterium sp. TJN19]|uniref:DUF3466 family protein n=1 Tax=Undibacterium sp. TJN19 TaxID=3413055 RepID=UPI003BF12A7A
MSSNEVSFQKNIYTYADLSTFGGQYSFVYAINNTGQMAGSDTKNEPGDESVFAPATYAAIWDNSYHVSKTTLLSGQDSNAYGINNLSTVVGSSSEDINGHTQTVATAWQNGETRYLPSLSNGQYKSIARAINDHGVIVGESFTNSASNESRATLWDDTGVIDLGTLGGKYSEAFAINNTGTVAGWASTGKPDDFMHPVIWKEGKIINLSPTHLGMAASINDYGIAAGFIVDEQQSSRATVWINQKEIILTSNAGTYSYTNAINNKNQIVGSELTKDGQQHALLWNGPDSAPVNLDQFLDQSQIDDGWQLSGASGINDKGWIIGTASNAKTHEVHAFVLTSDGITGLTGAAPPETAQVAATVAVTTVASPLTHEATADIWSGMV